MNSNKLINLPGDSGQSIILWLSNQSQAAIKICRPIPLHPLQSSWFLDFLRFTVCKSIKFLKRIPSSRILTLIMITWRIKQGLCCCKVMVIYTSVAISSFWKSFTTKYWKQFGKILHSLFITSPSAHWIGFVFSSTGAPSSNWKTCKFQANQKYWFQVWITWYVDLPQLSLFHHMHNGVKTCRW